MPQISLPYKSTEQDGRHKLSEEQKEVIKRLFPTLYADLRSTRKVADKLGVSRRMMMFIVFPERYQAFKLRRRQAKVHLRQYKRERHTLAMRKYRAKKRGFGLLVNSKSLPVTQNYG